MRFFCFVPILFLAGCAGREMPPETTAGFNDRTEQQEDNDFFYGEMWRAKPSPDDAEDRQFFYGGSPRR